MSECIFQNNTAFVGGALFSNTPNITIYESTFENNNALYFGGGIFSDCLEKL